MQLSHRLLAVANMVTRGNRLADVGTDHGYLPIYLVQQKCITRAIAMDINQGPLERAMHNISIYEVTQYIETRLSDGVKALKPGEADSLVIAGMGGSLMIKIITEGENILKDMKELILQPQSDIVKVRRFLQEHHYKIMEENMVWEDGKYYSMMRVVHGEMRGDQEIFFRYGRYLLEHQNPVLLQFLRKEKNVAGQILERIRIAGSSESAARVAEIKQEMQSICSALEYYEM